jgi:peptidoglycan/LPS O-acetylase OafA/YrhL
MSVSAPRPEPDVQSSEPATRRLGHVPALTGLRGIAVLLVVLVHSGPLLPGKYRQGIVFEFTQGGFLGVDLFFALSGFLITSLLLEEHGRSGRVGFRNFYARRALRLLPALYVMLAAFAVYSVVAGLDWYQTKMSIIWAVLYATNFQTIVAPASVAPELGHLWSLAIEEQFYFVWPIVFVTVLHRVRRVAPLVVGLLVAIYMIALNRYALVAGGADPFLVFVRLDTRADELLIGALAAVLWYHRKPRASRWFELLGWAGAATFVWCIFQGSPKDEFWFKGGFTLVGVAATAMVVAGVSGQWSARRVLGWRPLLILGEVSYGLYLWHLPIFEAVRAHGGGWRPGMHLVVAWGITAVVTAASWFLVERPANRLKRRFRRTPVGAPA